jgi:hypothetical protein
MADDDKRKKAPPVASVPDDPDAPPSAEEIAESERLRRELEDPRSTHEDVLLARALGSAIDPKPLDDDAHRALLDRALSDRALAAEGVDAPATPEEVAESERLREELEDPGSKHPDVLLARSLRHAVAPRAIEAATHRKILDRTLGETRAKRMQALWIGVFAAAAAIALLVLPVGKQSDSGGAPDVSAGLIRVHAADDLFVEPFPEGQHTSARIDRIASARGRDLRSNHFAKWGVH